MVSEFEEIAALLGQYEQAWLAHVEQIEHRLQLMRTLKNGMELLLLVGSYLIYYFIDCFTEILSMPLPLVR